MKAVTVILVPLFMMMSLAFTSCSTAKKSSARGGSTPGILDTLAGNRADSPTTLESLQAIADSPSAMLPADATKSEKVTETEKIKPLPDKITAKTKWKSPGLNPDEVNPGDIFSESAGPVLHKSLSLADEMPPGERRTLLNHFTTITTARIPMTFSRKEIAEMQSGAGANIQLPTRSVALDYRSESRVIAPDRIETLLAQLRQGGSGGVVESKEQQTRLKNQLASVRKKLLAGERLYMVTSTTESERLAASYPGAPVGESDVDLVRNVIQTRYPHLDSIQAVKNDNSILITGSPRILWEFETREIKLQGDQIVIDSGSAPRL